MIKVFSHLYIAEILTEDDLQNDPVEDSDQQTILKAGIIGVDTYNPPCDLTDSIIRTTKFTSCLEY